VIDGGTGYVCADIRALSRRITELAWNLERRQQFSRAAREYALGRRWSIELEPVYRIDRETAARTAFALEAWPAGAR
jgi:hypothetical protein